MVTKDKPRRFLSLSTNYNGYNCSKYALNFKFPIITPLNQWLLGATNGNQGQTSEVYQPTIMGITAQNMP